MAELEEGTEGQIQDTPEEGQSAQNPSDTEGAGSPPAQQEDYQAKLREYEEKLARQEERTRYLESTNQLLERFSQQHRPQQAAPQEPSLSPELTELDRTLEPLFSKRLKSQIDPIQQMLAQQTDANDALRFEMYLSRNHPDILDSEDSLNRVYQQTEQIRQQAAQVYGKYLSRVDAFLYAQGLEGVKEKSKSRQAKKTTQVKEEAKRQLQIQATRSAEGQPDARKVAPDIDSIRRRMMAGEKLTPEEKAKFRNHLANAKF